VAGDLVLSTIEGGIAKVVINRPERRNALNRAAWLRLVEIVRELRANDAARGMIVTGAGERAFAAGADVAELVDRSPLVALEGLVQGALTELEDLPFPTIAAINGFALGGGFELALACDLRVASATARMGLPEVGLGIIPGAGGIPRLLHHVSLARAKELVLSGKLIGAEEAERLGIVNRVVPPESLLDTAADMLATILERGQLALRLAKLVLNAAARGSSPTELERLAYTLTFYSDDRGDRMRSFLGNRASESEEG
jgi:enoyl-CoA hydratase